MTQAALADPITGAALAAALPTRSVSVTFPEAELVHQVIYESYTDGTFTKWDNYIIRDDGRIATVSDFQRHHHRGAVQAEAARLQLRAGPDGLGIPRPARSTWWWAWDPDPVRPYPVSLLRLRLSWIGCCLCVMARPAAALEVSPIYGLQVLGGQYFFAGDKGALSGNISGVVAPAMKFNERWSLLPSLNSSYQGTKQVVDLVGAGTLVRSRWSIVPRSAVYPRKAAAGGSSRRRASRPSSSRRRGETWGGGSSTTVNGTRASRPSSCTTIFFFRSLGLGLL